MSPDKARIINVQDSGRSRIRLGGLEGEVNWKFNGTRKQKSYSDMVTGQGPWIDGILETAVWAITFDVTPENDAEVKKLMNHDRYTPVPFWIDEKEQDTVYLNGIKSEKANQTTFAISNHFG